MPPTTPPRRPRASAVPRAEPPEPTSGPRWARAVHLFYDPIFDIRSRAAFQDALNDYVTLPERERAFHDTHLLFRLVQGIESVHGLLERIDQRMSELASPDLSALKHLAPIRAALDEISSAQPSFIAVDGFEDDEDLEEDEREDDEPPEDDELAQDPDVIYDTIPEAEAPPRHSRRAAPVERPQPPRSAPPRSTPPPDPEREALVGDLVPATEGPDAEPGDR